MATKLEVAERYSWYILNALMYKVKNLNNAIMESQAALAEVPESERNILHRGLENLIDHCTQSLKEHQEALDALKVAGFN